MRIDGGAQILDEQMSVRSGGDAAVAVPHEPLYAVNVDPAAEKLGRERVAEVMEAHAQVQRLGPERAAAWLLESMTAAIGAVQAVRAVALLVVLVLLLVPAPTAAMLKARGDARSRQSSPQNLLRVRFARTL